MKILLKDINKRADIREVKSLGILAWDKDNAYPQRIRLQVKSSGRAIICTETYIRFIEGNGFADDKLSKTIVNSKGLTADNLLRRIVEDFGFHKGFAVHLNYDYTYRATELSHVPFEHTRLALPDDNGYIGQVAVYDSWPISTKKRITKEDLDFIDLFNPSPEIIQSQVDLAGGWDKYKGQIFWYSAAGDYTYPEATLDSVIEDVDTDAQIKKYKNRLVRRDFIDLLLFIHKGRFENDAAREDFKANLEKFEGVDRANSIMLVETEIDEQAPEVKPFNTVSVDKDKKFFSTEETVQENIRQAVMCPPVLVGDLVAGKLGTAEEINDACKFYSSLVNKEQRLFQETISRLASIATPPLSGFTDFSIEPIVELIKKADAPAPIGSPINDPTP